MNYNHKLLYVAIILVIGCNQQSKTSLVKTSETAAPHLIEASEVLDSNEGEDLVFIDFRKPAVYTEGHIPDALNIWRTDIQDNSLPVKGIRSSKKALESFLGSLGIRNNQKLVIYDDRGSPDAARLWWLLRLYGFEEAHLLNGGLHAWETAGGVVDTLSSDKPAAEFAFTGNSNSSMVIDKDRLLQWLHAEEKSIFIVDARTKEEYEGASLKDGALRPGHIPGSIHIDWAEAIDYKGTKKFKGVEDLKTIYNKIGATALDTIVVYCHSGVRSSHTTFVLTELLGYKNVMNYDGSWIEWSS
ncbi:MAG: sulfurtransferase, partial [Arenibacter sp.]|nr:sulfurtransferase [Arenibacter sp.]